LKYNTEDNISPNPPIRKNNNPNPFSIKKNLESPTTTYIIEKSQYWDKIGLNTLNLSPPSRQISFPIPNIENHTRKTKIPTSPKYSEHNKISTNPPIRKNNNPNPFSIKKNLESPTTTYIIEKISILG